MNWEVIKFDNLEEQAVWVSPMKMSERAAKRVAKTRNVREGLEEQGQYYYMARPVS